MSSLVSVVIPLYESERFIEETLRSVLAQTHENLEVLVVDDGSPDASATICESLGDARIRVFRQDNRGSCRSRNLAISRASGDFVALLDHDDLWRPEKLERHLEHLQRSPDVGVSFGPSAFIDESGEPVGLFQVPRLERIDARTILCRNPIGNGSVPVIRREVFEAIRFRAERDGESETMFFDDECMGWEDVECWLRIALTTDWRFEGISDCLTLYRLSPTGFSGDPEWKQQCFERGLRKLATYAPDLVRRHGAAARAYHLRYLARRQIMSRNAGSAVRFAHRAVRSWPRLLLEEPRRTLTTLGAAYLQRLLPRTLYGGLESLAIGRAGRTQARRVEQ